MGQPERTFSPIKTLFLALFFFVTSMNVDLFAEPLKSSNSYEADHALETGQGLGVPKAVQKNSSQSKLYLEADQLTYDANLETYHAEGDVRIQQGDLSLRAQDLLWQATTQDVDSRGNVELKDPAASVSADRLLMNLSTRKGLVFEGEVLVRQGNFHLGGEEVEKLGATDYYVRNGTFTTCDGEIPDWKFSASELNVTLGGYARAKHVVFHIKDVPVLYTPYMFFPVKTERESGFLSPWFGYSKKKGWLASLSWYQVIDRHLDATIYLDTWSDLGLGKGLEYRYALGQSNRGNAVYYHVNSFEDDPNYDYISWDHRGTFPGNWTLTGDVEYASSQLFFDNFGAVAEQYNRDKTVSTITIQRNWDKLNLVGFARYIKDLETSSNSTLQRLPEMSLGQARFKLADSPIYLGLESYLTRFWRDQGDTGERLFFRPYVSASFTPGEWLEITPEISIIERIYDAETEDDHQFLTEYSVTAATRLIKTFNNEKWHHHRMVHSIEPKLIYTYRPQEDQDTLPLFDLLDRLGKRNDITYALVNRLAIRGVNAAGSRTLRDLMTFRLAQRYDLDESRNNLSGEKRPFSDVELELDLWPTQGTSLNIKSLIPVYGDTRFRTLTVGASAKDNRGNGISASYVYKELQTDYASVQFDTSIAKPLYLHFEDRYDFKQERELEKVLGVEYRSGCWSLFFSYRHRYIEDGEDDKEFLINFALSGIGENKGFGNGIVLR
jgi:LPS-assembly protein